MKSISKRQLVRNPAQASALLPGESMRIEDRQGGLLLTRPKRMTVTPEQMEAELQRVCAGSPALDSLALQRDET